MKLKLLPLRLLLSVLCLFLSEVSSSDVISAANLSSIPQCCPKSYILTGDYHCETIDDNYGKNETILTVIGNCEEILEVKGETNTSKAAESCVATVKIKSSDRSNITQIITISCAQRKIDFPLKVTKIVFSLFSILSLFCLFILFWIYWVIPKFNNLHGKIVLGNVSSVMLLTTFFLIIFNFRIDNDYVCKIVGYFGYFSTISMFSWMTIMCFDIFITFTHLSLDGIRSYKFYCSLSWGIGILLTMFLIILQSSQPPDSDLNPLVGHEVCFISREGNKILFLLHFPILIFMIVNILFFVIILSVLIKSHITSKDARISRRYSN